jgi:hypothetical protein
VTAQIRSCKQSLRTFVCNVIERLAAPLLGADGTTSSAAAVVASLTTTATINTTTTNTTSTTATTTINTFPGPEDPIASKKDNDAKENSDSSAATGE